MAHVRQMSEGMAAYAALDDLACISFNSCLQYRACHSFVQELWHILLRSFGEVCVAHVRQMSEGMAYARSVG